MERHSLAAIVLAGLLAIDGRLVCAQTSSSVTQAFATVVSELEAAAQQKPLAERKTLLAALYHAGRFADVRQVHRDILNNSQEPDVLLVVARSLAAVGKTEDAITLFERAADQCPGNGRPYLESGLVLVRIGDRQGGAKCFRRAIAADPYLAEAHYEIAVHATDADEARQACQRVLVLEAQGSELAGKAAALLESRMKGASPRPTP